jgi:hypothetical protein
MTFSRANPSPRYLELQRLYWTMHAEGEKFLKIPAEETFLGMSLPPQAARVKRLVERTGAATILDYGSGKGRQYDLRNVTIGGRVFESIADYWDVDYVHCYDPCFPKFAALPQGKFDGVISTDVLEHCPEADLPWVLEEMFGYAECFVFANVACYPARKRLPNGENAHCTIKPSDWWARLVEGIAERHPDLEWEFWIQTKEDSGAQRRYVEKRIGSVEG